MNRRASGHLGEPLAQSTVRALSIFTFVACVATYAQMVLSACDGGVCPWQGHLEIQPWYQLMSFEKLETRHCVLRGP